MNGLRFCVRAAVAFAVLLIVCAFAVPSTKADNRDVPVLPLDWVSQELRDHPLAGRIWSRQVGNFVSAQDYGTRLAKARFVLLGEVHDNADHHRLQAWAIRTISKLRGARLVEGAAQIDAVALEMLTSEEDEALDRFYGRNAKVPRPRTAADFGRLLKWDKLGWPDYAIYEPIVAAALDANLVLKPASPARAENRKVSKEGLAGLGAGDVERLKLAEPLASEFATALAEDIKESHCGMLPEQALPNMSFVQRLRDARMADAMLAGSDGKGAILIAGNGHVRPDHGVPWYLIRRGTAPAESVTVLHVEVEPDKANPADYDVLDPVAGHQADFVIFTPRHTRPEPCEEMRRQMEAIKAKRKPTGEEAK